MLDRYKGYYVRLTQLKNKQTGQYETVYILNDENKRIGIFEDMCFVDRFWNQKYIPSRRTETIANDLYEERVDD